MSTYLNPRFKTAMRERGLHDQDKALQILRRARDIIAAGWTRRQLHDGHGRYCAVGALVKASRDLRINGPTLTAVRSSLLAHVSIPTFNDQAKTKQPVLDLFDEAIAKLEKE